MTKWEYVIAWQPVEDDWILSFTNAKETARPDTDLPVDVLRELGADGWELVAVQPSFRFENEERYIFKRPLPSEPAALPRLGGSDGTSCGLADPVRVPVSG